MLGMADTDKGRSFRPAIMGLSDSDLTVDKKRRACTIAYLLTVCESEVRCKL